MSHPARNRPEADTTELMTALRIVEDYQRKLNTHGMLTPADRRACEKMRNHARALIEKRYGPPKTREMTVNTATPYRTPYSASQRV